MNTSATITFGQKLAEIPLLAILMTVLLSTLSGLTALLNAMKQENMKRPSKSSGRFDSFPKNTCRRRPDDHTEPIGVSRQDRIQRAGSAAAGQVRQRLQCHRRQHAGQADPVLHLCRPPAQAAGTGHQG
jgi:hypothetical protein